MIRTKVYVVLFVDTKMAALFTAVLSSRVSTVSRVSVMVRVRVSVK